MTGLEKKIYVGGIPDEITENVLFSIFVTFGKPKNLDANHCRRN